MYVIISVAVDNVWWYTRQIARPSLNITIKPYRRMEPLQNDSAFYISVCTYLFYNFMKTFRGNLSSLEHVSRVQNNKIKKKDAQTKSLK